MGKYARIEFLTSGLCNSPGEIVRVELETEDEVYYTDGCGRWCFLNKSEEGTHYKYIPAGTRLQRTS